MDAYRHAQGIEEDEKYASHAFLFSPYGAGSRRHLDASAFSASATV